MNAIRILILGEDPSQLVELERSILDAAERSESPAPSISRSTSFLEACRQVSRWGIRRGREPDGTFLSVRKGRRVELLDPREIVWARSEDDYTAVHARGGTHLVRIPLSRLEERLSPDRWVRIHRRYLVRLDEVRGWRSLGGGRMALRLEDPHGEFQVSRGHLARVRALLRLETLLGEKSPLAGARA